MEHEPNQTTSVPVEDEHPIRSMILGCLVALVLLLAMLALVRFAMMSKAAPLVEQREKEAASIARLAERYGVPIEGGVYSTTVNSTWTIDGQERECVLSDDTLPAPDDLTLLCYAEPMVPLVVN